MFFSDQQAAFVDAQDAGMCAAQLPANTPASSSPRPPRSTPPVARRKFVHFLTNFRSEPSPGRADGETVYKDRLDAMRPAGGMPEEQQGERVTLTLTVHLEDLIAHDAELADVLKKRPGEYAPLVRCARLRAARALARPAFRLGRQLRRPLGRAATPRARSRHAVRPPEAGWPAELLGGQFGGKRRLTALPPPQLELACADVFMSLRNEMLASEELPRPSIQVFLVSSQLPTPIRELNVRAPPCSLRQPRLTPPPLQAEHVTKLVCVPGIVIAASRCKARRPLHLSLRAPLTLVRLARPRPPR